LGSRGKREARLPLLASFLKGVPDIAYPQIQHNQSLETNTASSAIESQVPTIRVAVLRHSTIFKCVNIVLQPSRDFYAMLFDTLSEEISVVYPLCARNYFLAPTEHVI